MLRTVRVRQGDTTKLITGIEGRGIVLSVKEIKPCSFRGCHNRTRAVALLVLAHSALANKQDGYLSARQIAELGGLPYNGVLSNVGKWCAWGLIGRSQSSTIEGAPGVYVYKVLDKGQAWLTRHKAHMATQIEGWDAELIERRGYGLFEAVNRGLAENCRAPRIT